MYNQVEDTIGYKNVSEPPSRVIRPLASTRDLVLRRGEGRTTGSEPSES